MRPRIFMAIAWGELRQLRSVRQHIERERGIAGVVAAEQRAVYAEHDVDGGTVGGKANTTILLNPVDID